MERTLAALDRASLWLVWAGSAALLAMMGITVADVVLRGAINLPIRGSFDIVESALVLVVFLGLPRCFLREQNIVVDLVDGFVGPRALAVLKLVAGLIGTLFLATLFWNMLGPAADAWRFADRKPDFPVPIFALWLAMLAGCAASLAALALVTLRGALGLAHARARA